MQITISRRTAFIVMVAVMVLIPAVAYAGSVFTDVEDSSTHIDGITFMKDSGVSIGCDNNNNYCPGDPVTRAQMATFMYRLSGTDPLTNPSVNAQTLNGNTTGQISSKVLFNQSDDLPNADGTLLQADIEQASDGYLIVMGNMVVSNGSGGDWSVVCGVAIAGTQVTPTDNWESIDNGDSDQCTATTAVPLAAGSYTVTLEWAGEGAGVEVGSGSLWGIWVPFQGAGD
jgi:hypothetical protein